jgi:preprotein translocase subunit SecG
LFGFLLVILLIVGIFMSVVILLQAGKGGGLAAMGGGGGAGIGGDGLIGGRQAATLLTKSTWISGGLFLFLAFHAVHRLVAPGGTPGLGPARPVRGSAGHGAGPDPARHRRAGHGSGGTARRPAAAADRR